MGARTEITIDLGVRGIPVDELLVSSATRRYERGLWSRRRTTAGGSGGSPHRASHASAADAPAIPISTRERFLRIEVENGDDRALRMIEVRAIGHSRVLCLRAGTPAPTWCFTATRASLPAITAVYVIFASLLVTYCCYQRASGAMTT